MKQRSIGSVYLNGEPTDPAAASVSVFDIGFQRGYGCFEAMRTYGGVAFRLDKHLARLRSSATHLQIELPNRTTLRKWCETCAGAGDGVLRVYVTGGLDSAHPGTDNTIVVFLEPLPEIPDSVRLDVLEAPWHADGRSSELTGAKTLSYGPNLAATIRAKERGFDDAALVGSDDVVLEGPTFSLGWINDDEMCTPGLDRHILASITREATIEVAHTLGVGVREETFRRSDLIEADEVFVMSTVREVLPVTAIGAERYPPGPVTAALAAGFRDLVARETS